MLRVFASFVVKCGLVVFVASPVVGASTPGEVCTIVGTAGDDVIVGTPGRDVICALAGDDRIEGLAGDDLIYGGPGDDVIDAGPGADVVWGLDGDDVITLGDDSDTEPNVAGGGSGTDRITGTSGDDTLYAGPGAGDVLFGEAGDDVLVGGVSESNWVGQPDNSLDGGDGDDRLYSGGGSAFFAPGLGSNVIYGSPFDDIVGGPTEGRNRVSLGAGRDLVLLGFGGDRSMADVVALGPGDDFVEDISSYSTVYGGAGDDGVELRDASVGVTVFGGAGDDGLSGDVVIGGPGSDWLDGWVVAYAADGETDRRISAPTCVIDLSLDTNLVCGRTTAR